MQLIEKEAVISIIENIKENKDIPKNYGTLLDILRRIRQLPTVDAEPVVHCKDCVHWNKNKPYNERSCKCEWFSSYHNVSGNIYTHNDDYCGYGAKKRTMRQNSNDKRK